MSLTIKFSFSITSEWLQLFDTNWPKYLFCNENYFLTEYGNFILFAYIISMYYSQMIFKFYCPCIKNDIWKLFILKNLERFLNMYQLKQIISHVNALPSRLMCFLYLFLFIRTTDTYPLYFDQNQFWTISVKKS